ncbi:DMT family transporter [Rhodovibrionaceae bacterium A322]
MISQLFQRLYSAPLLLLTLTALMWSANAIFGQLAVGEITPFMLVFLRWAIVSVVLWSFFGKEVIAHWPQIRPKLGSVVLMAALGFTAFNGLFYVASHETSAINIGILQGSMPILVLLGALLFQNTKATLLQICGVCVTLVGVVLVTSGGDLQALLELSFNRGDILMLIACLLYSFYTLAIKNRPAMSGLAFFTLLTPIAAVTALPLVAYDLAQPDFQAPTLQGWIITFAVAFLPSSLAQIFFLRGVDLIGPGRAGVFINLVPIFAALMAVVFLGQAFEWYHALALFLVLGGIWLAQRSSKES